MAAALTCLQTLQSQDIPSKLRRSGERLTQGLVAAGHRHGFALLASGPPAVPFVSFVDDPSLRRQQRFCAEVTRRGAFLHPHHNWFMSAAHTDEDIDATLAMADQTLAQMRAHSA